MNSFIFVFDPTASDSLSKVRGIGRYLQILKENFADWTFTSDLSSILSTQLSILINPFFNFLQQPLVMKRIAKKQVAVIHDLIPLKYPKHFPIGIKGKLNIFLNSLALRNYDVIITDSEASKKDIINILRLPENIIHVVYPCLPKIFTKKRIENKKAQFSILNSPFCLYVGDATWNKNLVNLAKALKIINVSCLFVGKVFNHSINPELVNSLTHKWQSELKIFYQAIQGDKRFVLKGFVPDIELIKLYQQARLNILPSRDEGFGFSYLEAASQKCPSVLSDIPVLHEISENNALFANPEDPQEMAKIIEKLFYDQKTQKEFGEKAFERNKYFFNKRFKDSVLSIIQSL